MNPTITADAGRIIVRQGDVAIELTAGQAMKLARGLDAAVSPAMAIAVLDPQRTRKS